MNILLVYPQYPDTFWSFRHALKFISKKVSNVPLGLITVASLLPTSWNKKLIDLNVSKLKDKEIKWADYVFISAVSVQFVYAKQIIGRCLKQNVKIVAGGPLFTEEYDHFNEVDHLVLDEAEVTLPLFLEDLKVGRLKKIYRSNEFADITKSPLPDYSLLKLEKYATAGIQYSRGCPFDCEFCDITALLGHHVRTKTSEQIISELDQLLHIGWKGAIFFVDDNFIGNKNKLKFKLLPAIMSWMEKNNKPFQFMTETSINLADDHELMGKMVKAGFDKVFIGIETMEESCLMECNKTPNNKRNLKDCVNTIQHFGLEVAAGFIVGFDNDPPDIFRKQVDFIQKSGIIIAMVGLLNAPRLSKLYQRLQHEGRITDKFSGDNTDYSMNFIPVMDKDELLNGYRRIIENIYSCKAYYDRVFLFLKEYNSPVKRQVSLKSLFSLLKSMVFLGVFTKGRIYFWKILFWTVLNKPKSFPLALTYSVYGYHFRKVFKNIV